MKHKELQFPSFVLLLLLASSLLSAACSSRSERLVAEVEALAYTNLDSAARLLAQVDTSALSERARAHLALARALVHEEEWQHRFGDTAVCLAVTDTAWEFHRVVKNQLKSGLMYEDDTLFADSSLLRAYQYYYRESFCGTSDDKEVVRRFGRACYALSRRCTDTDSLLQFDMLIHQAIHAAEASEDWATAYRAYHRWSEHCYFAHGASNLCEAYWSACQALKCYDLSRDCPQNFLWLINDYGRLFLHLHNTDPRNFPMLLRAAELTYSRRAGPPYEAVFQLIDSVQHAHVLPFLRDTRFAYSSKMAKAGWCIEKQDVVQRFDRFQEKKAAHDANVASNRYAYYPQSTRDKWFRDDQQKCARVFDIETRNYIAAGYALKASALQSRLMVAIIAALALALVVLLLLLWNWRTRQRRKHEAEQAERAFEAARAAEQAERLAEQLRQKDTMIAMLRGHIMDKSEILERLEQGAGGTRRTVIDARNWREIEATLDTLDNGFAQRLRQSHPQFSEDDIRLCMLTRLKLSNNALASIYAITVSAVQHRKQKLKKEGFGVTDPAVPLEQVIASF